MAREIDDLTGVVVDAAVRLHRDLGPGLLESVYEALLHSLIVRAGLTVQRQHPIDVLYDGIRFPAAFRVDLLVEDRLLVELKSVERLMPAHGKQLLTYLRLAHQPVGLLINFGGATLKEGLKRIVNDHRPSASPRLRVNQRQE